MTLAVSASPCGGGSDLTQPALTWSSCAFFCHILSSFYSSCSTAVALAPSMLPVCEESYEKQFKGMTHLNAAVSGWYCLRDLNMILKIKIAYKKGGCAKWICKWCLSTDLQHVSCSLLAVTWTKGHIKQIHLMLLFTLKWVVVPAGGSRLYRVFLWLIARCLREIVTMQ